MESINKSVWNTLSAVDVNKYAEKKNGFTYLSWAWAWSILKTITLMPHIISISLTAYRLCLTLTATAMCK